MYRIDRTYRIHRMTMLLASGSLILGCAVGGDDLEMTGDRADRVPLNSVDSDTWRLADAVDGDLAGGSLVADLGLERAVNDERSPVSVNWRYERDRVPTGASGTTPRVHVASSKEFRLRVSARELASGIALPIASAGAIVKLSAHTPVGVAAFEPEDIALIDKRGTLHQGAQGMDLMISAEQMNEAGLPFSPGTSMFRLSPALGAGPVTMTWDGVADADPTLEAMIHVREPLSDIALELQTDEPAYLQGQRLSFRARWDGDIDMAASDDRVYGRLLGPENSEYAVELTRVDGAFKGTLALPDVAHIPGYLWTLEVEANGRSADGKRITRTVETAFAYAPKTARFTGNVRNHTGSDAADVHVSFDMEVASAGRYAVTSVLYGTGAGGAMEPLAVAQSAAFLTPGQQSIDVSFDRATIDESGLSAPFEVRDVTLVDQTRLGLLHRQATALAFE